MRSAHSVHKHSRRPALKLARLLLHHHCGPLRRSTSPTQKSLHPVVGCLLSVLAAAGVAPFLLTHSAVWDTARTSAPVLVAHATVVPLSVLHHTSRHPLPSIQPLAIEPPVSVRSTTTAPRAPQHQARAPPAAVLLLHMLRQWEAPRLLPLLQSHRPSRVLAADVVALSLCISSAPQVSATYTPPLRQPLLTAFAQLNTRRLWSSSGEVHGAFHGLVRILTHSSVGVVCVQETCTPQFPCLPDDQPFRNDGPENSHGREAGFPVHQDVQATRVPGLVDSLRVRWCLRIRVRVLLWLRLFDLLLVCS